jgi:hypothetical protein
MFERNSGMRRPARASVLVTICALTLTFASVAVHAQQILLVSDATSAGAPPNNHDDSLIALLEEAGYTVDVIGMDGNFQANSSPWAPGNEFKLDAIDEADLILVSRRTNSGAYQNDRQLWNEIEVPLLLMSGYLTRGAGSNRWGWTDSGSGNAATSSTDVIVEPGGDIHPFTEGFDETITVYDLSGAPTPGVIPKGVYLPNIDPPTGGEVIARMDGRPFLFEMEEETDLDAESTGGGPYGITGGPRVFFGAWGYDIADAATGEPHQAMDFSTSLYLCLLLNVIDRMLGGEEEVSCEEDEEPFAVEREISSDLCTTSRVDVTLTVTNLVGPMTIVETLSDSALVLEDGGGVFDGEAFTLTFEMIEGDENGAASFSYAIDLPDRNNAINGIATAENGGTRTTGGDTRVRRCPEFALATIALVSDAESTGLGANIHDDSLVDFLEEVGFDVDTSGMDGNYREGAGSPWAPENADTLALLESADLVLVSRRTGSGSYDDDRQQWNELEVPLLLMSGYLTRGADVNRWGWHDGGSADAPSTSTNIDIEPDFEDHPLVAGFESPIVAFDLAEAPLVGEIPKGVYLPTADFVPGGEVIARMAGMPILGSLPEGTDLDAGNTAGGPYGELGADRVFLANWGYDLVDQVTDVPYQFTDFTTEDYRCLVLNVIHRMVGIDPPECAGVIIDPPGPVFRRGDADGNGVVQLTDAITVLGFLFQGTAAPGCFDAADADDNGAVQLTDAITVLGFLFQGTPAPPFPGPIDCDEDVEPAEPSDAIGCTEYTSC